MGGLTAGVALLAPRPPRLAWHFTCCAALHRLLAHRYVILKGATLTYYRSERDVQYPPRGRIDSVVSWLAGWLAQQQQRSAAVLCSAVQLRSQQYSVLLQCATEQQRLSRAERRRAASHTDPHRPTALPPQVGAVVELEGLKRRRHWTWHVYDPQVRGAAVQAGAGAGLRAGLAGR